MPTILVTDQDLQTNEIIALALRMEGYDVFQAHDGEQVLKIVQEHSVDLIFLGDLSPKTKSWFTKSNAPMDGFELARILQENHATTDIKIIFLTWRAEMEDVVYSLKLSVDFIAKPFTIPDMLTRVRTSVPPPDSEPEEPQTQTPYYTH